MKDESLWLLRCFYDKIKSGFVDLTRPTDFNLGHARAVAVVDVFGCKSAVANPGQTIGAVVSVIEHSVVGQVAVLLLLIIDHTNLLMLYCQEENYPD